MLGLGRWERLNLPQQKNSVNCLETVICVVRYIALRYVTLHYWFCVIIAVFTGPTDSKGSTEMVFIEVNGILQPDIFKM